MGKFLVVGGTSGIGKSLVSLLVKNDHLVTVAARNQVALDPKVSFISLDATDQDLNLPVEGPLDGVAYCPGTINLKPFHRLKPEDYIADFEVNVLGAVKVIQAVLPNLKMAKNASIVLFSTVAADQGLPFHSSVAASKAGVEGMARSLAAELAPTIRVNTVAPSITNTPLAERLLATPEKIEASAKRHPLGKVGEPADIANAAYFLLTDQSGWMTGQTLAIDGGMSKVRLF